MHEDYIPQSYQNLLSWLTVQETDLTTALATAMSMTADERTALLAAVGALKTPLAARSKRRWR